MSRHGIVIAGGGPTGLMLACELALCGVRRRVLEALPRPTGLSKALGFSGRAVDILEFRGILDRFRAAAPHLGDIGRLVHFGGIPLDVGRVPGLVLPFVPVLQADTEAILGARAAELGIEIERGSEVVGIEPHDDHVAVTVAGGGGGRRGPASGVG
ncbi:MAG TPA: FAD-dependent monooxygenase [Kofleriaceae bacterium]|nr:FAD-dependent monooxygenase [Kofleriaceae bacterium]